MWLPLVVALVVAVYVCRQLKYLYLGRKWKTQPVKRFSNYLLGLDKFVLMHKLSREGYLSDFHKDEYDKHGETFEISLLTKNIVSTLNPDNIKAMVSTQFDDFGIGVRKKAFGPLLGNGVFVSEGETWKHSRLMMKPQFAREQIAHVQIVEPHIQVFAQHVRKFKGQLFDIQHLFHKLTFDAATDFLLGESVSTLRDESIGYDPKLMDMEEKGNFDESFSFLQKYVVLRASLLDFYWVANSRAFRHHVNVCHSFTQYFVDKALQLRPEELEKKSREGYTFMYELVKDNRDPVVLRDQILNLMLAGRSTTGSLLLSTFFELARNPPVWEKLKDEIRQHFGTGETKEELALITFENLKRCTYLRWVLNEALRMYPPVAKNLREALKDTTLPKGGGPDGESPILIRKKSLVVFHIYAVQRLEKYYGKDAHIFRPERWALLSKIGWAFMPFSSGPRICLGQQFALTEASYITVRLAQMFSNIESHDSTYPPRKSSNATMQYLDGVNISLW